MFNLDDILRQAQGGGAAQSLARQFGISPDQAQAAMEALAPAFQMGFQRQAQADPQSMGDLLQKMSSGAYADAYGDPGAASRAQGDDVLSSLFGSKDGSRAVAQQAAALSGVPGSIMKAMLPVIASMIMGGMFKQANAQGAGGVLGQLGSILAGGGAGGVGSIPGGMLGGGGAQQQPSQANMGGGGGLGDILGQVLGGGGGRQPMPQNVPQGGGPMGGGLGPLGDILGQILAGGAGMGMPGGAGPQADPDGDPRRRMPEPQEDAGPLGGGGLGGGGLGGGGLGGILRQMRGQGRAPAHPGGRGGELPQRRTRGGVEDEISDMLGGGRAPGGGYAQQSAPQGSQGGGSLGDILGQMFQTGQQQSQSNMDAWSDIFSQMTGQRRR